MRASNIAYRYLVLQSCVFCVLCLEPVTTGLAVLGAIGSSILLGAYDHVKCQFYECCTKKYVLTNLTGISSTLHSRLYGQPLVIDTVSKALSSHVKNDNPTKALVLSFHGWTGVGKNFVSHIVANYLYKNGMNSKFVHNFIATVHFKHASKMDTYKDDIAKWVSGNVSNCPRNLFIFDEMDKMPAGVIDAIKPFIDTHPHIHNVDFRKSIFLFLSNTAGNDITRRTLQNWEAGKSRDKITRKEMEEQIHMSAYNEEGGLWHSLLIQHNLIDFFIPFLPLERKHVKLCVEAEMKHRGHRYVSEQVISEIADDLTYFPQENSIYSTTGCKRVAQKVAVYLEDDV